jgi:hypothetical protein
LECGQSLEHDPEKWKPVSDKIMLKAYIKAATDHRLVALVWGTDADA